MLTTQEFTELVEDLTSQDPYWRSVTLRVLLKMPTADERVLPYLEPLLDDNSPCLLGIPYIFGEIRWLAAKVLASERAALGIGTPVHVPNVVRPVDTMEIIAAEHDANIKGRGGVEGLVESLALLRDRGYLHRIDINLSPLGNALQNGADMHSPQSQRIREFVPAD